MRSASLVTLTVLLVASRAEAQLVHGLSLGSGVERSGAGGWTRESRFSPALRLTSPLASFDLDASVAERRGTVSFDRAALSSVMTTPAFGPLRFSIDGAYRHDERSALSMGSVAPALSLRHKRTGAWFGSVHAESTAPALHAGVWTSIRSAVLSVTSRTEPGSPYSATFARGIPDSTQNDTTGGYNHYIRTVTDTVSRSRTYQWSQLEARLDWSYRRLALTGVVATSRGLAARTDSSTAAALSWGRVNAAFMLNHRLSLTAAAGSQGGMRGRAPQSRFVTLGVRFSPAVLLREPLPGPVRPAASSFSMTQVEPGLYKMVLRVASARSVELSGDFNHWTAVAMTQTTPGVWVVSLAIPAGTHRLNVRIDGDSWSVPPGLPAVDDEFNGRVGILVVR
jgi:hypothetical protein